MRAAPPAAACESLQAMTFASRESKPGGTGPPSTTPESTRTPCRLGLAVAAETSGAGSESVPRRFGDDPRFERGATGRQRLERLRPGHRCRQRFGPSSGGDLQLRIHEVHPVDLLGHGVFHLEPGVHLQEVEGSRPVLEQELDRFRRPGSGWRSPAAARLLPSGSAGLQRCRIPGPTRGASAAGAGRNTRVRPGGSRLPARRRGPGSRRDAGVRATARRRRGRRRTPPGPRRRLPKAPRPALPGGGPRGCRCRRLRPPPSRRRGNPPRPVPRPPRGPVRRRVRPPPAKAIPELRPPRRCAGPPPCRREGACSPRRGPRTRSRRPRPRPRRKRSRTGTRIQDAAARRPSRWPRRRWRHRPENPVPRRPDRPRPAPGPLDRQRSRRRPPGSRARGRSGESAGRSRRGSRRAAWEEPDSRQRGFVMRRPGFASLRSAVPV